METTMTYNDIYFANALISDLSGLKLPAKATTEKLLIRAHYNKQMQEFEEFKKSVNEDEEATEESKKEAIEKKATETVENFTPRYFSVTALEQIVEAACTEDSIPTRLAAPVTNDKGEAIALGKFPTELWLETFVSKLVEE